MTTTIVATCHATGRNHTLGLDERCSACSEFRDLLAEREDVARYLDRVGGVGQLLAVDIRQKRHKAP